MNNSASVSCYHDAEDNHAPLNGFGIFVLNISANTILNRFHANVLSASAAGLHNKRFRNLHQKNAS
jgi:hypothetical protein